MHLRTTLDDVEIEVGDTATFAASVSGRSAADTVLCATSGHMTDDGLYAAPDRAGRDA